MCGSSVGSVKGSVGGVWTGRDGVGEQGGHMDAVASLCGEGAETMVETSEEGVEDGCVGGGGARGGGEDVEETMQESVG